MTIIFKCFSSLLLLLSLTALNSFAQYKVSGLLVNKSDKSPIEGATITLSNKDIVLVNTESDEHGRFTLSANEGNYLLQIYWYNELKEEKNFSISEDTQLDTLLIDTDYHDELASVAVTARKNSLKMENGRLVFIPPQVGVQSAFEILQTTPTLMVTEEAIQLIGKGAPQIMINGKWSRMSWLQIVSYLKSLPGSNVDKIEIIRNPGAEFDAESQSGYINIVLKTRKEKGYQGSIDVGAAKATYFQGSSHAQINANWSKFQLNGNIGYLKGKAKTIGSNILHYSDKYWVENAMQDKVSQSLPLAFDVIYAINKKHKIGAGINYSHNTFASDEYNTTNIFNIARSHIDSSLLTQGSNPETINTYAFNFNYDFKMNEKGKKLRFDFDHFYQSFNRNQDFSNYQYDENKIASSPAQRFLSGNDQNMLITTANLAMQHPLTFMDFSYGAKYTFISNRNQTSFYQYLQNNWVPDNGRFDNFVYDETTYALYAKAAKKIKKWDLNAGLRFEHTQTLGNSNVYQIKNSNQYRKFFPSADITFNQNDNNIYTISYSRRIDRPMFAQVNPFRWYHSQYAFTNGNPSLQPYFSHNFDFNYIFKGRYTMNVFYGKANDVSSEFDLVDTINNIRETRVDNILNTNWYGISLSANSKLWNRWLLMPQVSLSYTEIISKVDFLSYSSGWFMYVGLYQQISLGKHNNWKLNLNTSFSAPRSYGIMQFKTLWTQSASISYLNPINEKWQFTLSANDIFRSGAMRYNSIINETLRERYVYRDRQSIGLNVRYYFARGNNNQKQERKAANEEEMNRAGR